MASMSASTHWFWMQPPGSCDVAMNERVSILPIILITVGTVCGLAATDLILPAIPMLPDAVSGTAESAQWVLAGFALGTGVGLLVFGELGARFRIVDILIVSSFAFALLSFAATRTGTLVEMSVIRFFQGIAASASAVYAPVMVKSLYDGRRAIAMIGRIGSIESMAPAIAPIIGALLLAVYGWQSSFYVVAVVAAATGIAWLSRPALRQKFGRLTVVPYGYLSLLRSPLFLRYALSQACTLGAVLVIVFSAPKVVTGSLGGSLADFIVMQVLGIVFFVVAANMTGVFMRWWGDERTIFIGSAMTALGCAAILLLSFVDQPKIPLLWFFFVFVNLGLGIRGPAGFYMALMAAGDNDSRGSALIIVLVMVIAAGGTGAIAPHIERGLMPLAIAAAVISSVSVLTLVLTPLKGSR